MVSNKYFIFHYNVFKKILAVQNANLEDVLGEQFLLLEAQRKVEHLQHKDFRKDFVLNSFIKQTPVHLIKNFVNNYANKNAKYSDKFYTRI